MVAVPLPRPSSLDAAVLSELSRVGVLQGTSSLLAGLAGEHAEVRKLGWPDLERVLPDGGLPRGVVEIASPLTKGPSPEVALRGGATTIALAAVRAAHEEDDKAWCAWVTCPSAAPSLYAPSAAQAGVDLDRLLVVRAEPASLARTAVKVAASGAFEVVVVDAFTGLDGRLGIALPSSASARTAAARRARPKVDGALVVRKLALSAEDTGATIVLLSNGYQGRSVPWPVALRLEVERRPEAIAVRVTKDRRGRVSAATDMRASSHVVRVP